MPQQFEKKEVVIGPAYIIFKIQFPVILLSAR